MDAHLCLATGLGVCVVCVCLLLLYSATGKTLLASKDYRVVHFIANIAVIIFIVHSHVILYVPSIAFSISCFLTCSSFFGSSILLGNLSLFSFVTDFLVTTRL